MLDNFRKIFVLTLILFCFSSGAFAVTITSFTILESSSSSWVARGLSDYTVTEELGWSFNVFRNFDNGINFNIRGPALTGTSVDLWFIEFSAPFYNALVPGFYYDFQRWPFQDYDRPGLSFGSTGRLDNSASGFFEILDVAYDPSGDVISFAANFTHYGETLTDRYAIAELRYNYTSVPEPSSLILIMLGLLMLGIKYKGFSVRS